jgi:hypothetical protein
MPRAWSVTSIPAEVTFDGAVAYAVGSPQRGLPNLARHVLTTSRFYCVQSAASTLRRGERIAEAYVGFRTAFGRRLGDFPAVRERLAEIRRERKRALACYLELLRLWEAARGGDEGADVAFRILLSLCKPVLTERSTRLTREAMVLLGGNGIEERFSPLPRLYRDALIMEIWEGPHDVLFAQELRHLRRFGVNPVAFGAGAAAIAGWRRVLDVNVMGRYHAFRAALPQDPGHQRVASLARAFSHDVAGLAARAAGTLSHRETSTSPSQEATPGHRSAKGADGSRDCNGARE